jgi:hypothetical protein
MAEMAGYVCAETANLWQAARAEVSQRLRILLPQPLRYRGVKLLVFRANGVRDRGGKLPAPSAKLVRDRGERQCVKVETLRAYDTPKKVRCSSVFLPVPRCSDGPFQREETALTGALCVSRMVRGRCVPMCAGGCDACCKGLCEIAMGCVCPHA